MTKKKQTEAGATELSEESIDQVHGGFAVEIQGAIRGKKAGKVNETPEVQNISDGTWKAGPV